MKHVPGDWPSVLDETNWVCKLILPSRHSINSELNDDKDITKGMNNFIGQVNNTLKLLQVFRFINAAYIVSVLLY